MKIYFIKTQYTNNIYKIDDFYLPTGEYRLNENKQFDVNFKADDISSVVILPSDKLSDNTSVRDYTHIIVPLVNKVYSIVSFSYVNEKQLGLTLSEDPFLANYQTLKNEDIIINKTNDSSKFIGINSVSPVTIKKQTVAEQLYKPDKTYGKWAVLFFQTDVIKATGLKLKFQPFVFENYEFFTSLTSLNSKYPATTGSPSLVKYFEKIVAVRDNTVTPYIDRYYQFLNYNGVDNRWLQIMNPVTTEIEYEIPDTVEFMEGMKTSLADISTLMVILPFNCMYNDVNLKRLLSFNNYVGNDKPESLLDIKIIDSNVLDIIDLNLSNYINIEGTIATGAMITGRGDSAYVLTRFKEGIDISKPVDKIPTNMSPFKRYFLSIYGSRFEINPYYMDDLKINIGYNSGTINFEIYSGNIMNVIASGAFTNSIRYSADALDSFNNLNPTYKEQFATSQALGIMDKVIGGTMTGAAAGGLHGALGGAAVGLGTGLLEVGVSYNNDRLREKGLLLQPDKLYGDSSDVSLQLFGIFGMFWITETIVNGADEMKLELAINGFPVNYKGKISDLLFTHNYVLGYTKLVGGYLIKTIVNNYVTGFINSKLAEGVTLI